MKASVHIDTHHQFNGMVKFTEREKPTVSYELGNRFKGLALCDLRVAISILPYNLYKQLGLNQYIPYKAFAKLVDRIIKPIRGIIENMLIEVANFFFQLTLC